MSRILLFLILVVFAFPAHANDPCNKKMYHPIAERGEKGLFYEIAKCGQESSYIFGTMHSDAENLIPLLAPVYEKLDTAKRASFELKEEPQMILDVMKAMYFDQNSPVNLENSIGPELYQKVKAVMKIAQPMQPEVSYRRMKPWAVAILMQYPPNTHDGIVVDARLQNYAKDKGVKVIGLETAKEQLGIFQKLDIEDQIEFLKESVESYDETTEMNSELTKLYLDQDLQGMQKLADEAFAKMENEKIKNLFIDELINARNFRMVEGMQKGLEEGSSVTAVGALHLPGEKGILALLESQGYKIYVVK